MTVARASSTQLCRRITWSLRSPRSTVRTQPVRCFLRFCSGFDGLLALAEDGWAGTGNGHAPYGFQNPSNIMRSPLDGHYYALISTWGTTTLPGIAAPQVAGNCLIRTADLNAGPGAWRAWGGAGFNISLNANPYTAAGAAQLARGTRSASPTAPLCRARCATAWAAAKAPLTWSRNTLRSVPRLRRAAHLPDPSGAKQCRPRPRCFCCAEGARPATGRRVRAAPE